jgi:RNA polymerase sigma factor (sigma-70 family)
MDIEQLIRNHETRLRNFVRRKISNESDVDDLLQDTYLEAFRCKEKFLGNSKPETWLFGIAVNLIFNHYRRTKRCLEVPEAEDAPEPDGHAEDPLDTVSRSFMLARIKSAVDDLAHEQRQVFALVVDGSSYEQAASELGIPIGTVRLFK